MRIVSEKELEGMRIVAEIGPICATSMWHSARAPLETHRETALEKLRRLAREFEADAVVGLDVTTDEVVNEDLAPVPLRRVQARGVAVKLVRAA
ncbi:MAG: heavy metal-binding domain-containing protein [Beijerinckiaceae bacterium]|jgi:uncharacterized protein YbjQ (UPF0145 family)